MLAGRGALLQGRLRCSSCSLVSDLLREQWWGRLSSDTSAGIALPCNLDSCLRACFLLQAVHNTHSQSSSVRHPRTQRAGGTEDPCCLIL